MWDQELQRFGDFKHQVKTVVFSNDAGTSPAAGSIVQRMHDLPARIGFGRSQTDLYEECFRRGLTRDDFVVCGVEESTFNPDEEVEFSPDV